MHRITLTAAAALLASVLLPSSVIAQSRRTVIVAGPSVVLEEPRGDSRVLGQVSPGTALEVIDTWSTWYMVAVPANDEGTQWQGGWIRAEALQMPNGRRVTTPADGRFMIRGFGQVGGLMFSARNSFQAIVGNKINTVFGTGAQVVLPNGMFGQASIDRFRKTGGRALVSGGNVFTLQIPDRLTVTAIETTVGIRKQNLPKVASYFGGGVGWHTLDEEVPSDPASRISKKHIGYHVVAGAEVPVLRWIVVAGEAQWATVPKALGESGISAHFNEKDLGGIKFRFKMMFGF